MSFFLQSEGGNEYVLANIYVLVVGFFENGGKYPKIGQVKREKGWESKGEKPALCEKAQKGRKKRTIPEGGI